MEQSGYLCYMETHVGYEKSLREISNLKFYNYALAIDTGNIIYSADNIYLLKDRI